MRVDTRKLGGAAEALAENHLREAGYSIRARNVSCKYGELDIVAEKGELLCFVEVRSRAHEGFGAPVESVMYAKQRKVVMAALYYLNSQRLERDVRFDVISITGWGPDARLEHIENAFDAGF